MLKQSSQQPLLEYPDDIPDDNDYEVVEAESTVVAPKVLQPQPVKNRY